MLDPAGRLSGRARGLGARPRAAARPAGCDASQTSASSRGASSRIRPPSRKSTRSQAPSTRSGRCSETTTATPADRASSIASSAPSGSSCEVGSSSSSSCGPSASTEARQTRWSSPPDSSATCRSREMRGADRGERPSRARADQLRRRADVLQPERDLGGHAREHDLVLGILEERRDGSREVGRPRAPGVVAGDLDAAGEAAAVEVRHEPGQRAQQRRLAAAGGAEQRDHLARLEVERDAVQRRCRGLRVGERQLLDPR